MARVRRQVDRALVPLDGLRALTRPNRSATTKRPLTLVAAGVVEALRPVAAEQGVELRLHHEPPGTAERDIEVDGELVRIILDNLVANALEGNPEGKRARHVVVSILADDAHEPTRLRISDDGPGLPPALAADRFEPLRTEKSSGLGLGLPIARALARSLGGDLTTAQVAGYATSFELTLPARTAPPPNGQAD
jgi:signal transduction histidine kinase